MKATIHRFGRVAACLLASLVCSAALAQSEAGEKDQPAPLKVTVRNDVVYGTVHGAGLLADIAFPEAKQPLPAIISVHGGRWVGGHKRDASTIKVEQWAGFGFFAMSIDYRLKGCTPAPACYQDFQCAIRYVHAHAQELN
ncbi:MAG: alpha/beta hydrolase fold domain-containing protein, partial [Planctomycetaceae bacterium]